MSKKNVNVTNESVNVEATKEVAPEVTNVTAETTPSTDDTKTKVGGVTKARKKKVEKEVVVESNIKVLTNAELAKLFKDNGCECTGKAVANTVVYNSFKTQSRILQQKKAYQLLLTNGHKLVKNEMVETDNDDVSRFKKWYGTLSDTDKSNISGYDTIDSAKLSKSELPRERTVKLLTYDLLTAFIKYMSSYDDCSLVKEA